MTVHPRWRGEHMRSPINPATSSGSSPLARGALTIGEMCNVALRFIPAGAGSTYTENLIHVAAAVHPRWRGEHPYRKHYRAPLGGSSPLARGAPVCDAGSNGCERFIPAGAGSTIARR